MKTLHAHLKLSTAVGENALEFRARVRLAAELHKARAGLTHSKVSADIHWLPGDFPGDAAHVLIYVHE